MTVKSIPNCHFVHECEEFRDNQAEVGEGDCLRKLDGCKKNCGHENFFPVCNLKMEDVPRKFQTDEGMRFIQDHCNRIVKIRLSYTSLDRPNTWYGTEQPYPCTDYKGSKRIQKCGTGYIYCKDMYTDKPCPCENCWKSGHPVIGYMEVMVSTARHVVYDDSEAVHTVIECFYDAPDRTGVELLYGVSTFWYSRMGPANDRITVYCVTHDKDLMDKLNRIFILYYHCPGFDDGVGLFSGFTVSHPHGLHKHISFGHPRFYIYSLSKAHFPKHPGFVKCRLMRPICSHSAATIVSQCQEGIKNDEENKMYLENVTCPSMVEAGIEYLLPDTFKMCVPFYHGDMSVLDCRRGSSDWFEIPDGSGYINSFGNIVYFPQGMDICCKFDGSVTLIYDVPTCPGSSGARVFIVKFCSSDSSSTSGIVYQSYTHSGADQVLGNKGFHGYLHR